MTRATMPSPAYSRATPDDAAYLVTFDGCETCEGTGWLGRGGDLEPCTECNGLGCYPVERYGADAIREALHLGLTTIADELVALGLAYEGGRAKADPSTLDDAWGALDAIVRFANAAKLGTVAHNADDVMTVVAEAHQRITRAA